MGLVVARAGIAHGKKYSFCVTEPDHDFCDAVDMG